MPRTHQFLVTLTVHTNKINPATTPTATSAASMKNGHPVVVKLRSRGIGFRSLTEGLHTEGPMGKAMLTIMAAFAQLERDTMIERTRAGLAAAAANGRKGGRPRKVDDADAAKARQLREKGITATDIAKMLGVSRATVSATFPMVGHSLRDSKRNLLRASSSMRVRGVVAALPQRDHAGHDPESGL